MQPPRQSRVTAYGLDRSAVSWVMRPEQPDDVAECIALAQRRGWRICPAGGRNSFGDVFLLDEHMSLDLRGLDRILAFDAEAGTMTVEAGALERDVLGRAIASGWQLSAASGSLWNTIGGDLSSNINGKDSWKAGSFGDQIESLKVVLADGSLRQIDRQRDAPLFAAVIGGLGLLGVVLEVSLRLRRAASPMLSQRSVAVAGVEELVEQFAALRPEENEFAYAWVDAYAEGDALGRAVFESARFVADGDALRGDELRRRFEAPPTIAGLPPGAFWGVVSRGWKALRAVGLEGRAFAAMNAIKYAGARRRGASETLVDYPRFQYPMVRLFPHWNLKFAPEGFNEVQALFPAARFAAAFAALMSFCRQRRQTPELCAVRRHRADDYDLSFAGEGLSVTIPFSLAGFANVAELDDFRRRLVATILDHGGKIYLSKFPYLDRDAFERMYPRHVSFAATKARVDPQRLFWSEAAGRLLA